MDVPSMLGRTTRTLSDEAKTPQDGILAQAATSNTKVDVQNVRSRVSQR